ncbi:MAG TPA: hypothetical protein PKD86_09020 [Gemmatales bacterium]|nr:hypothetical protein [Gemmatales bacterium]HMP59479.1 hypothetical protein [Gemmatales bacterium]
MSLKQAIYAAADALRNVVHQPPPTLGIDLDGCCDESPFFNVLTHCWPGDVVVVTFRDDRDKAVADLNRHGIRFTEVVLVNSFEAKAQVVAERGIAFFIDDQPEALKHVPAHVSVLLFRNGGNYDYVERKWMVSSRTAKMV